MRLLKGESADIATYISPNKRFERRDWGHRLEALAERRSTQDGRETTRGYRCRGQNRNPTCVLLRHCLEVTADFSHERMTETNLYANQLQKAFEPHMHASTYVYAKVASYNVF